MYLFNLDLRIFIFNLENDTEMAPRQTMLVKGDDGILIEMEVLSTTEKESSFQKSAPIMNPALASLFGFLNLVPGNDDIT